MGPPPALPLLPDTLAARPPEGSPRPPRLWLHVLLFAVTFLSALYSQLTSYPGESYASLLSIPWREPERLLTGLPFAATLMAILLAHEMGHYLTARRYGVDQSLPYFIPAPTLFGTLGAIIFMRSQPPNRSALLNVAVMGPYAGLVLAIPASAWGLAHSIPVDPDFAGTGLMFGDSLLFAALEGVFSPNGTNVLLHPVGLAGWVGLFITSLNLIPAAQLDGGHVAYALFGRRQEYVSLTVVMALLFFGVHSLVLGAAHGSQGGTVWIAWAFLLFVIGVRHPPVRDERQPLTTGQRINGLLALAVFAATFIPVPLRVVQSETPRTTLPLPLVPEEEDAPWDDDAPQNEDDETDQAPPAEEYEL